MSETTLQAYCGLTEPNDARDFLDAMEAKGYSAFYEFIEEIRDLLKEYGDADKEKVGALLRKLRADFPAPQRYSPSWTGIWDEFQGIYESKNELLDEVPPAKRDGEWQVQLDNPYTTEQAACYPGLSFVDAAYLYAYFKQELKPNEYLRLQKVSEVIVTTPGR